MKLVDEIVKRMHEKSSEELLAIWKKNDRNEWSNEAFEAIRQVMTERNIALPDSGQPVIDKPQRTQGQRAQVRQSAARMWGVCAILSLLGMFGGMAYDQGGWLYFKFANIRIPRDTFVTAMLILIPIGYIATTTASLHVAKSLTEDDRRDHMAVTTLMIVLAGALSVLALVLVLHLRAR